MVGLSADLFHHDACVGSRFRGYEAISRKLSELAEIIRSFRLRICGRAFRETYEK
jgi:hypothetical protein